MYLVLAGLEDQHEDPVSQWKALDPVLGVLRVTQHLSSDKLYW